METVTDEINVDAGTQQRTEDARDAGRRYRFEHLTPWLVLGDMSYGRDDPGPGDRVPDFDLPVLGGGRFRSSDLGETGPTLLIFGSRAP